MEDSRGGPFLHSVACRGHGSPGGKLACLPPQCGSEARSEGTCLSDPVTMATAVLLQHRFCRRNISHACTCMSLRDSGRSGVGPPAGILGLCGGPATVDRGVSPPDFPPDQAQALITFRLKQLPKCKTCMTMCTTERPSSTQEPSVALNNLPTGQLPLWDKENVD